MKPPNSHPREGISVVPVCMYGCHFKVSFLYECSMSVVPRNEDYIMVQSTTHLPRPKSNPFASARRSIGSLPGLSSIAATSPLVAHGQTGSNTSLVSRASRCTCMSCDSHVISCVADSASDSRREANVTTPQFIIL